MEVQTHEQPSWSTDGCQLAAKTSFGWVIMGQPARSTLKTLAGNSPDLSLYQMHKNSTAMFRPIGYRNSRSNRKAKPELSTTPLPRPREFASTTNYFKAQEGTTPNILQTRINTKFNPDVTPVTPKSRTLSPNYSTITTNCQIYGHPSMDWETYCTRSEIDHGHLKTSLDLRSLTQ